MKTPKEKSTWHQKHQNQCVLFFSRNRFNFAPGIVCCFFFFFHLCHSALAKVALRVREGNASLSESIDEDNLCKSAHILGAMCVFNSVRVKQSTPVPAMSLWNDRINAMSNWWWSTHFFYFEHFTSTHWSMTKWLLQEQTGWLTEWWISRWCLLQIDMSNANLWQKVANNGQSFGSCDGVIIWHRLLAANLQWLTVNTVSQWVSQSVSDQPGDHHFLSRLKVVSITERRKSAHTVDRLWPREQ